MEEQSALIRASQLFDAEWYAARYFANGRAPDDLVMHYLAEGCDEGFEPGPNFSGARYLKAYKDVADQGVNPLVHFLVAGQPEGRSNFIERMEGNLRVGAVPVATPASFFEAEMVRLPLASPPPIPSLDDPAHRDASTSGPMSSSILFVSGEPDSPGNFYRILHYVAAARANGWQADWVRGDRLAEHIDDVSHYDVLMIWRAPWDAAIERAVGAARASGRTVVFDCDDLMIEPHLATTKLIDGIRSQFLTEPGVQEFYGRVRQTMLAADFCFTTSEQLAFYMRWAGKTTFVNRNGFSQFTHDLSRSAARDWSSRRDGLVRLGYAGGSRTHQKDLGLAMCAIAQILREHPQCRLVLFRTPDGATPLIDVEEYAELDGLHDQIEWRALQPLMNLPLEMARFDINLAPLEVGNPFCEAKSQLKFFEAGLVDCPTVASPTGPYRDFMTHGETGYLACTGDDWYACLNTLVTNEAKRRSVGRNAYLAALSYFGPRRRALDFGCVLDQLRGGPEAARSFALGASLVKRGWRRPDVYPSTVHFEAHRGGIAEVTVTIPLYNYEDVIVEALDSVANQTLEALDLVIVDGGSPDTSLQVALDWAKRNAGRFNRIVVMQNDANYGLGLCRNSGFETADTPYVMLLDADNRLLPQCCERLLSVLKASGAAYVYPTIQHFGASSAQISNAPYSAQRYAAGNYVDAMALVSKEAWAMVGGVDHVRHGWEDYDFWVRIAELGLSGEWCSDVLAEYRVHAASMLKTQTVIDTNYRNLNLEFKRRHPWVSLIDTETRRIARSIDPRLMSGASRTRLDDLLPLLRCPTSGQKLAYDEHRTALVSHDGMIRWPLREGRPCMAPTFAEPAIMSGEHISNELPDEALDLVRQAKGWVLNLSGGGSREKLPHVVEMEFSVFRHTDVVGDAHHLPFDDGTFDTIIVMNAFEHYRDPVRVAAELRRVLKPGGRLHVRTAFLQPLHEAPYHFYNCTRYGLENWFAEFETERLHVSKNFSPNHTLAWIASEAERALREDLPPRAAQELLALPVGRLVELWRDPAKRNTPLWTDFERLSKRNAEGIAAGFELFAQRPRDLPVL